MDNFQFIELIKSLYERKGAFLYSPIGSMCVLRSFIPGQQKKTARPGLLRHFVPSRWLHPPCAAYAAIPCGLAVRKRF